MKHVIELEESSFEQAVRQAKTTVVVNFSAPWCGPGKMFAPLLEQFASEFAGRLKFAKANMDEKPELAGCCEITGVPTLVLFRGDEPVDQLVGFPGPPQLKAWLDTPANAAVPA